MTGTDPTEVTPIVSIPAVRELPPSCKLVWYLIDRDEEVTQSALIEATGMSPRTVRYALDRLHGEDLIDVRPYMKDARKCVYSLSQQER